MSKVIKGFDITDFAKYVQNEKNNMYDAENIAHGEEMPFQN
jgi:hypothetical protein